MHRADLNQQHIRRGPSDLRQGLARLPQLHFQLRGAGRRVLGFSAQTPGVAAAASSITTLDVLVHNAGVADIGTIEESSVDQWRRTLEANVIAVAELTRVLLPALRAAGGHVVLINSGAGLRANAGWGSYAASKFALRAFGDALRLEEPALRVTSIHPGRIDTDMQRDIVAGEGDEYDPERFLKASTVARAVLTAVETPSDAHPTEIVLRPTGR